MVFVICVAEQVLDVFVSFVRFVVPLPLYSTAAIKEREQGCSRYHGKIRFAGETHSHKDHIEHRAAEISSCSSRPSW